MRRLSPIAALAATVALAAPGVALGADSVTINRFSPTITGNTGGANNTVTVNLLRNTRDRDGNPVRLQVDTATTTADGAGNWTVTLPHHAPATARDDVEIVATGGTGAPAQLTVGSSTAVPASAKVAPARFDDVSFASVIDGHVAVASDGSAVLVVPSCPTVCQRLLTVDGGAPTVQAGNNFPQAPHLTNADTVRVGARWTLAGATVTVFDGAPLLATPGNDDTPPVLGRAASQPSCQYFVVTSEAVCRSLAFGTFSLTLVRAAATVRTQTITVPARPLPHGNLLLFAASAPFPGVQTGDQLVLAAGSRVLSRLTIDPMTVTDTVTLDALNGSEATVAGSCVDGLPFTTGTGTCSGGMIAAADGLSLANIGSASTSGGISATGSGQLDDTSAGATFVDVPQITGVSPSDDEAIQGPFEASALARFNDPAAIVAARLVRPVRGPAAEPVSLPSGAPIDLAVAPLGTGTFASLGNAAAPGGVSLAGLAPGSYAARWTLVDGRGDTRQQITTFTLAPPLTTSPIPSTDPATTSCTALRGRGGAATVAARATVRGKARANAKRPPRRKQRVKAVAIRTVTLSCGTPAGGRVVVWLERAGVTVASGRGVARGAAARVPVTGRLRPGTYRLIELIDGGGRSAESNQILTLR